MSLPIRIDGGLPNEPVISVDGAWGAPGLNLSHWPGHATPEDFRHDLSTGSALRFAALSDKERERWAAGCTAIQNNHYGHRRHLRDLCAGAAARGLAARRALARRRAQR